MMSRPSIAKLFILVMLRQAEHVRGKGYTAQVAAGHVAAARRLALDGLLTLGRAAAPASGTTVTLTDDGRKLVEVLVKYAGTALS